MRKITRVDATLDFEFKGHFEGHKVNWGQNVGFYFRDDLNSVSRSLQISKDFMIIPSIGGDIRC